jgi:hypothetical protein
VKLQDNRIVNSTLVFVLVPVVLVMLDVVELKELTAWPTEFVLPVHPMKIVQIPKEETNGVLIFLDNLNVDLALELVIILMSVLDLNQAVSLPMVLITPTVEHKELETIVWMMELVSHVLRTLTVLMMVVPLPTNQFVIFLLEPVYHVMTTMIVRMLDPSVVTTVVSVVVATTVPHLPPSLFLHPLQK